MRFDKQPWRRRSLECMRKHGTLGQPYLELGGEQPDEMYKLLARHLPHDGDRTNHYYAIEKNPETLMLAVLRLGQPKFNLVFGDAYVEIPHMLGSGIKLATIGLDHTEGINDEWWRGHRDQLINIVDLATRQVPRLALILNHTLDLGYEKGMGVLERIDMHTKYLVDAFRRWNLRPDDLRQGSEGALEWREDRSYYGGYDIYRSRHLRMITVRLVVDGREKRTTVHRG
jgi:hypothetical protein